MFKKKLLTIAMVTMGVTAFAQTVGVNTDGNPADPSALLDVRSTDKGMLIPRMGMAARDLIATPATGLLIFQTDNTPGFYYNSGTPGTPAWTMISGAVQGTQNGVLVGQGMGNASTFSAASTGNNYVLATPTAGGAPAWVDPMTTLTTSDATGAGSVVVTNGAGQMVGTGNATIDVQGNIGGVMYGQGAGVSATFTGGSTGANQVLHTATMGGVPTWIDPNGLITKTNITPGTGSAVMVTNGTNAALGNTPVTVDVQGTQGGVMYGTGAGTAATFSAAGTTGQYLRSNGTAAPAFATAQSNYSCPIMGAVGAGGLANGGYALSGPSVTYTATGINLISANLLAGSFHQAGVNERLLSASGTIAANGANNFNLTIYLYKYAGLAAPSCGTALGLVGGTATLIGQCTVSWTSAQYGGKYNIPIPATAVADLAAGDALVMFIQNNSGVAVGYYNSGTATFSTNVQ